MKFMHLCEIMMKLICSRDSASVSIHTHLGIAHVSGELLLNWGGEHTDHM